MSILFPTSLDSFPNPVGTDLLENAVAALDHDVQHSNVNDAIEALEEKVGIDGSAVITSHDYKLSAVIGGAKALTSGTSTQLVTNLTLVTPTITLNSDATGDMYYRNSSGAFTRLPIGATLQILNVDASGIPAWVANPAASDGSTTVKGVVEIATDAEVNAGTSTGSTGAILVIPASSAGPVGAGKIVQFTAASKYPAADGSLITGISIEQNIQQQIIHVPTEQTTIAYNYATTAYTGMSSTNPVFTVSGGVTGGASPRVSRFIKLSNGSLVLTHSVSTSNFAGNTDPFGICVIGSYVYVFGSSGGSPRLARLDIADLQNETLMTISGTAMSVNTGIFSDGTNLYNMYTAGTAKKYTISGTTATSSTDTNYTSSGLLYGYWSDGTYLYGITPYATYKWALSGGARTTGTVLSSYQYILSGTIQTDGGGIFKEVGNTSQIITILANKTPASVIGTVVPITTF